MGTINQNNFCKISTFLENKKYTFNKESILNVLPEKDIDEFKIGTYVFNSKRQLLSWKDHVQKLTTKESDLLKLLLKNTNWKKLQ